MKGLRGQQFCGRKMEVKPSQSLLTEVGVVAPHSHFTENQNQPPRVQHNFTADLSGIV